VSLYTLDELRALGVAVRGADIAVDRSVQFFGAEHVLLGNRVRIDCFGLISAGQDGIEIGSNIHIAAGCYLFGSGGRITLADFANLSSRVAVYTASDDYSGGYLTGPTVPNEFKRLTCSSVSVGRHAIIGAGSVILPGVSLGFGAAVGALTVVRRSVGECEIVSGNPAETLPRRRDGERLRRLEAEYLAGLVS
jgi:acetyltransferase-like isoleucine patch superfamily enzyme